MRRKHIRTIGLSPAAAKLSAAALLAFSASSVSASSLGTSVPDQVILDLAENITPELIENSFGITRLATIDYGDDAVYLFSLNGLFTIDQFIAISDNDDRIDEAEPNFDFAKPDPGTQSFFLTASASAFWNQPLRDDIAIDDGWSSAGTGATQRADGAGVIVAVIDTGLDANAPVFNGRVSPLALSLLPGDPSIGDEATGADTDGDGVPDEYRGHGTLVAGVVTLVAPGATILPIRAVDPDGVTNTFLIAQAIDEAVERGANVINLSLGTSTPTDVIDGAVIDAIERGVVVVASAGNEGPAAAPQFPAASPSALGVAGVATNDVVADFSNVGPHIALTAPAVDVVGPVPGGFSRADGTSFAAPTVAGAAAIVLSVNPDATPAQVAASIAASATDISAQNPGLSGLIGAGRLDITALSASLGLAPPYPAADFNGDRNVTPLDLSILLGNFGSNSLVGDATGDAAVTALDISALLATFGQ